MHGPWSSLTRRKHARPRTGSRQRIHRCGCGFKGHADLFRSRPVGPAAVADPKTQIRCCCRVKADLEFARRPRGAQARTSSLRQSKRARKELVADPGPGRLRHGSGRSGCRPQEWRWATDTLSPAAPRRPPPEPSSRSDLNRLRQHDAIAFLGSKQRMRCPGPRHWIIASVGQLVVKLKMPAGVDLQSTQACERSVSGSEKHCQLPAQHELPCCSEHVPTPRARDRHGPELARGPAPVCTVHSATEGRHSSHPLASPCVEGHGRACEGREATAGLAAIPAPSIWIEAIFPPRCGSNVEGAIAGPDENVFFLDPGGTLLSHLYSSCRICR